jgi:regulation of enolase protein 1 (concanavalin A-like superfamily)
MTSKNIPWEQGKWETPPRSVQALGGQLVVEAAEGSDYWQRTLYGFQHASGHSLLAEWNDQHAVEVSFSLRGFCELYDQAGLMLWHSGTSWIKAGVEVSDGILHAAVVVTDGFSDWSLAPVPEWANAIVTMRASRANDAVIIRASANGQPWRTLRVARFPHEQGKLAGPFLCAPKRAGFKTTFTRWSHTSPDTDLHEDPPIPDTK